MRPRLATTLPAVLLAAALAGCAHAPVAPAVIAPGAARARLALLPLENLSGRADASDALTRMLFVELVRKPVLDVVEMGEVEAAMDSLRLRSTSSLPLEQLRALASRLSVGYVMVGTLLESSTQHTAEGDLPSVGVALKLLDVGSGKVVWAQMAIRSGDDRETLFGWGREENAQRLAATLARQVLADLRLPASPASGPVTGGGR